MSREIFWAQSVGDILVHPKSNRFTCCDLIFRFSFANLRYIPIDSSTTMAKFPEIFMNFNRLFLKLNQFHLYQWPVLRIH